MDSRLVLARAIEMVTFLFAAFSGFLGGIVPPEESSVGFAAGTASILMLCIFLLISAALRKRPKAAERRCWLIIGAALTITAGGTALLYKYNLDRLTFGYPPERPTTTY